MSRLKALSSAECLALKAVPSSRELICRDGVRRYHRPLFACRHGALHGGLSPAALAEAYLDWATHLAYSPGKRIQLVDKAMRKAVRFSNYLQKLRRVGRKAEHCIEPLPQDHRFTDEDWQQWPYNLIYQAFC